jgi:peptide/nickel transport system substrate-binding protein
LLLAGLAFLAGSAGGEAATLRVTRDGPIFPVFHPVRATDNTYPILYMIYSNLVHLESDEKTVIPDLADSWTASADATKFTFKLNQDAAWQDGADFTADDVVFTAWWAARYPTAFQGQPMVWTQIEGAKETEASGAALSGVRAIDENTVEITLAAPNADFLQALAGAPNVIVPKHLLEAENGDTIEKVAATTETPIGTGPYVFANYEPDQFVELKANPDYFKGEPGIESVIWKILPSEQIATQIESGDLDMAIGLDHRSRETLAGVDGIELVEAPSVGMVGLFIRTENPALADPRVRQALYHGIDRQGIIDSIINGAGKLLWNPPGLNFEELEHYAFDPEKARSLLEEAGWDSGTKLKLVYWRGMANAGAFLPVIQQQLADIGVNVELTPLEIDDWDNMVTSPDRRQEWDIDLEFGGLFGLGPDQSSRNYGVCEGPLRQSGYQNCELAQLFVAGRATTDQAERDRIYMEVAKIINQAADVVYLWQPILTSPVSSKLSGVEIYPFDRHSFMRINEWSLAD